ncbi:hypothetical protein ACSMXN_10765 [Jatrophihabitans sp. DSM 45814]
MRAGGLSERTIAARVQVIRWLQRMDYQIDDPSAKLPTQKTPRSWPRPTKTEHVQLPLDSGLRARTHMMVVWLPSKGCAQTSSRRSAA